MWRLLTVIVLGLLPAGPGLAQSPWWTGGADEAIVSGVCLDGKYPSARSPGGFSPCLRLYCFHPDGQITLELSEDGYRLPASGIATLAVDGHAVVQMGFTVDPRFVSPAIATFDRAAHAALLPALTRGTRLAILFDNPDHQRLAPTEFTLSGAEEALREWAAACPTPVIAPPDATPATDPARFLAFDAMGVADAGAEALARSLLATKIGAAEAETGRRIEVLPTLVTFSDGRRMLRVALCDPTYFGMTGCESHYLIAAPGAQGFTSALELIGAGDVWFDARLGVQGWPDLIFGRTRLANPVEYARWRWDGAAYALVGPL